MPDGYDYLFKLLLIGDSGVGKVSLVVVVIDNGLNVLLNKKWCIKRQRCFPHNWPRIIVDFGLLQKTIFSKASQA